MTAIFTAVDISTLTSSVSTLLVGFIGVGLIFVGYKYAKKAMRG